MYSFLLQTHSYTRWVLLIAGLLAVVMAFAALQSKRSYGKADNITGLLFIILCDIQLLIGLVLYVQSPLGIDAWKTQGMKLMGDGVTRKIAVEHLILMLAAIIIAHIGRSKVKIAASDNLKHKNTLKFYGISLILILAGIPWDRL